MTKTAQALYSFFSGFGIPAYGRNNIPDKVDLPYITFEVKEPEPLTVCLLHAWVCYRGTSYAELNATCDAIKAAVGTGITLPTSDGFIALFRDRDTPFMQEQPDPDKTIRVMYLTFLMHANTN